MAHSDYQCVLSNPITILEVIGYIEVLLIRCWSVLDRDRGYTSSYSSVDYNN